VVPGPYTVPSLQEVHDLQALASRQQNPRDPEVVKCSPGEHVYVIPYNYFISNIEPLSTIGKINEHSSKLHEYPITLSGDWRSSKLGGEVILAS